MSTWSIFVWLFVGFWLLGAFQSVRQAWQQNPENPTRVFLADFAGLLILLSVAWNLLPYGGQWVMNNARESVMFITTVKAGIGTVERGEFVIVPSAYGNTRLIQRLIALPKDELSVKEGTVHINAIPLGAKTDAFLQIKEECKTTIIPPEHFAIMDWLGTESISCSDIQIRPIEDLQAHCLAVLWPFSTSCHAPTNEIPQP